MTRLLALLLGFAATGAAFGAPPIGRLFFTPAERAQLDMARIQKRAPEAASAQPAEPRPTTQTITYSGIVRRSDGKSTVWLNNRPADGKDALSGLDLTGRVGPDGVVTVQVPETGGSINLKVGQRAELQTGRVAEARPAAPDKPTATADAAATADTAKKPDTGAKPESVGKSDTAPPPSVDGASHRDLQQRAAGGRSDAR